MDIAPTSQGGYQFKLNLEFLAAARTAYSSIGPFGQTLYPDIGKLEVLIDNADSERRDVAQWRGRTRQNRLVFVPRGEEHLLGRVVSVRVEKVSPWAMQGAIA